MKTKAQSKIRNPKGSSPARRRVLALISCAIFIPFTFGQLDQVFVMPERLKQLVNIFGVEPTITDRLWRVRLGVAHQGVEAHDVMMTVTWLDAQEREIGHNDRQLTMGPGDTSYVSLSYINKSPDRQAVKHRLEYQVKPID